MDARSAIYVRMARYAIALALHAMGARAGDRVLVPAHHCGAMIAPMPRLPAGPVFHRDRQDRTVDLDDLIRKIDGIALSAACS